MADSATPNPMSRLQAAMSVYLAWRAAGGTAAKEALLARHADLADLLEPLFEEHAEGEPAPGGVRCLGDYQLVREIGRGGMGVVYEAVQMSLNRRVALKVLPAHLTLRPSAIARFQREATVAAKLAHPSIVPVFGVGSSGGAHYFAMELIEGVTLDRAVEQARLAPERSGATIAGALRQVGVTLPAHAIDPWQRGWVETMVRIAIQVADALQFAHAAGVVHRDVKPANVFLRADGSAVLGDFGLARDPDTHALTLTGDFAGTPNYVSPEQAQAGRARIDHRSDVFSLGATLYECLTLAPAFAGDSVADVLAHIIEREPVDPLRLAPELPPDLAAVVLKALEKEPSRRYQSAGELAADLRAFLEYRPVAARRASAGRRVWRWARREPWRAALVAVAAVAVPALTALGGYALATRTAVHAGEQVLLRDQVERALQAGFVELGDKRPREAMLHFARARGLEPDCPEAVAGLALATNAAHGAATALQALDHLDAQIPHRDLALVRADLLRRAGRTDEAAALEAAVGPPRGDMALFLAGNVALEGGDFDQALALLTRAMLAAPRARLHFHGRRAQAAARAQDAAAAADSAHALTSLWPDSAEAWFTAAPALALSDRPAAIAAARRSVELQTGSRARARTNLAWLLLESGDADGAIEVLQKAISEDPALAAARLNLGLALLRTGRATEAMTSLTKANELEPQNPDHWIALGDAQLATADPAGAHASYERAVAAAPDHSEARLRLGLALRRGGDIGGALDRLREAVELDPRNAAAWASYGNTLAGSGDLEAALEACTKSTELAPQRGEMWVGRAMVLAQKGDADAALAAARRAVALAPALPVAHEAMVRILGGFGRDKELEDEQARWSEVQRSVKGGTTNAKPTSR
jgi:tetratricopeptide (TPR) repeat protein